MLRRLVDHAPQVLLAAEQVDLDTLETRRQAAEAAMLGAFQRWQAPEWKGATLSLR